MKPHFILRKVFLMAIALGPLLSGCGKIQNSNYNDATVYSAGVSGSSNFLSARGVLATKCLSCHSSWGSYTEAQFVSAGLVQARSTVNSSLYTAIRGNDTGIAGDMPLSGSNLTADELTTIKTWINGI